ncbi:MAG TPA: thioredoxin family protein [Usitatibacter sp.]|nr:thioredoxin family protein [Usitatibacter sp.]
MRTVLPRLANARLLAGLALVAASLLAATRAAAGPVYPDPSRARADIAGALERASAEGKRVIVDFGGDWCGDCRVLDAYFHRPENAALLAADFVLVRVNVGSRGIDRNIGLARGYGIPLARGVPALAVLEADGRVVYSQAHGEFESMRRMDPASVNGFLRRWAKPRPPHGG